MTIDNIMLIDDNKIDLFVNQRIIEKYNPAVKTRAFTNGLSAISFFKLLELNATIKSVAIPRVILLDINMPEMSGFNFFEEFKQLNIMHKNKIDVYILSSSTSPDDIKKAQNESRCAGYITKPLTVDKLKSLLDKSVSISQDEPFKKII
ncbi:response regulator [Bizionia myxarmorum]|uniref:Response regulator n=1 Tax=Bizionia myxarmorum TaxID=291186 RepID=A0A5D0RCG0_9FLAO|nr:response regulator [Bizionia myxarmorum]TYB79073.1 response regulator [Bizionia myxarmorum]